MQLTIDEFVLITLDQIHVVNWLTHACNKNTYTVKQHVCISNLHVSSLNDTWKSDFLSVHILRCLPVMSVFSLRVFSKLLVIKNNAVRSLQSSTVCEYAFKYTGSGHGVHQKESECARRHAQHGDRWLTTPPRHLFAVSYSIHARCKAKWVMDNPSYLFTLLFWRAAHLVSWQYLMLFIKKIGWTKQKKTHCCLSGSFRLGGIAVIQITSVKTELFRTV